MIQDTKIKLGSFSFDAAKLLCCHSIFDLGQGASQLGRDRRGSADAADNRRRPSGQPLAGDAGRHLAVHRYHIVAVLAGRRHTGGVVYMDRVKQLVGGRVAQLTIMFENDQFPHCHFAAGSAVVIFKHVQDGLPQKLQVLFRKAGDLAGQIGGDVPFRRLRW